MAHKKLVLLHSNDMHGDFLSKDKDTKLIGGVSMLSGYVNRVRSTEDTVLYAIAGDMLQGSLIDSEYKGISTMEIMNYLGPDIACVGNHEVDYGLAHLLFLEKYAKFPIISANFYIKNQNTRLLNPSKLIEIDGLKILFIGIITESILDSIKADTLIGTFIDVKDAAQEVAKICNAYRTTDVDLTVLLTHIGFENDLELAKLLDPALGVDLIIGGHSHTILQKPAEVHGIRITQAGVGTIQLGRFDLVIDSDTNAIVSSHWQLVPIDENHCPHDPVLEEVIHRYQDQVDAKYKRILTRFTKTLTHPSRLVETELGNLFADIGKELLGVDLMLLGSGSLRKSEMGPIVTMADLYAIFPFAEAVHQLKLTGRQLKHLFTTVMDPQKDTTSYEHYQLSQGSQIIYDNTNRRITSLIINGEPVEDERLYKVGIQTYHINNTDRFWDIPLSEILANGKSVVLCTSMTDIIEEYFMTHTNLKAKVEGRIQRIGG